MIRPWREMTDAELDKWAGLLAFELRWWRERGWLDADRAMEEALVSIKRAGADLILTYAAADLAGGLLLWHPVEPVSQGAHRHH